MQYFETSFHKHCIFFDNYSYKNIVRSYVNGTFTTEEVDNWCDENTKDWEHHSVGGETTFYFKNVEDAMAFKLRWE